MRGGEREDQQRLWRYERLAWRQGYRCVVGLDEVGRGALAGPVVAAAVVLPGQCLLPGLNDSKLLRETVRERLWGQITRVARCIGIGLIDNRRIDTDNIFEATKQAMLLAMKRLELQPDFVLIDGFALPQVTQPQLPLVKGDQRSASIAAASVIAKVVRDRVMRAYARQFCGYGFEQHKGYGTILHRRRIQELGPSPIHRLTFRGVGRQ